MVIGWAVCVRCYVPAGGEDEEIREWSGWVARFGCEDAENRGVDMVHRDRADVDKFGQVILVRHLLDRLAASHSWTKCTKIVLVEIRSYL